MAAPSPDGPPTTVSAPPLPRVSQLRDRQRSYARAQMLATGLATFAELGYAQTTIDELVDRCGCARGTFYSYFPDGKDGLFRAIYQDLTDAFQEAFLAGVHELPTDVVGCAEVAARVLVDICREPGRGRFFMIEAPALPHVLGQVLGTGSRLMLREFSSRIAADQEQGLLPHDLEPVPASQLMVGMIRELGTRVTTEGADPDRLITSLRALLRGSLTLPPAR